MFSSSPDSSGAAELRQGLLAASLSPNLTFPERKSSASAQPHPPPSQSVHANRARMITPRGGSVRRDSSRGSGARRSNKRSKYSSKRSKYTSGSRKGSHQSQGSGAYRRTKSKKSKARTMEDWESLLYTTSTSRVARQDFASPETGSARWGSKWFIFLVIGTFAGLMAFAVNSTILTLQDMRLSLLNQSLRHVDSDSVSVFGVFLFYSAVSLFLVFLGSILVVFVIGSDRGSGVPEVIGFLNGVAIPRVFNIKTLAVKFFSVICAVGGGLPAGSQGPLVNMSAAFAAGFSQGRSKTFNLSTGFFSKFRNPGDQRDFVSAGAAAGVAAAFKAPIGGLLFGLEEVSSWWSRRLTFMVLFTCILASTVHLLFDSAFQGWKRNPNKFAFGELDLVREILFPIADSIPKLSVMILIPTVLVGFLGGLLGALFTWLNVKIALFRQQYINPYNIRRVVEPCVIILLYITCCFFFPLWFSRCIATPADASVKLEQFTCQVGSYNPLGSLTLVNNIQSVLSLYDRNSGDDIVNSYFDVSSLLIFLTFYFIFACYAAGTALSIGSFIPMLTIGAIMGRLFGLFMIYFCNQADIVLPDEVWVSPGVFALIGSAAFTSGVTRLTVSLTVIILEMCWDLSLIMPIVVSIVVAKWTADLLTQPWYTQLLMNILQMPFLGQDHPKTDFGKRKMYCFVAADIMACPVVVLKERSLVGTVLSALLRTKHNGFPVVTPVFHHRSQSKEPIYVFKGTISRSVLIRLLTQPQLFGSVGKSHMLDNLTQKDLTILSDRILFGDLQTRDEHGVFLPMVTEAQEALEIDLEPYINTSAFCVNESFSLRHCYDLFRSMALRHLTVVNFHNEPVGMITRKDLMGVTIGQRITDRFGADPLRRIQHLQASSVEMADTLDEQPDINEQDGQPGKYHSLVMMDSALLEPDLRGALDETGRSPFLDNSIGLRKESSTGGVPVIGSPSITSPGSPANTRATDLTPRVYSLHRYPESAQRSSQIQNQEVFTGSIPSPVINKVFNAKTYSTPTSPTGQTDAMPARTSSTPDTYMRSQRRSFRNSGRAESSRSRESHDSSHPIRHQSQDLDSLFGAPLPPPGHREQHHDDDTDSKTRRESL